MRYFDFRKHWRRKCRPHLDNPDLKQQLDVDFALYCEGRQDQCRAMGYESAAWSYNPHRFPRDYESCDWSCGHRGPEPDYWRYVKHGACHWLANFQLRLAQLVYPVDT